MRVRRPLSNRSKLLASVALVGLLLAAVGAVVQSAFTSTVRNSGNTFEAGSISLTGSVDRASAFFDLDGLKPGAGASRCIKVSYGSSGGLASTVRLFGVTSGALAQHLKLKVTRGTFPGAPPAGGACTGFTPAAGAALFDGTLAGYPDSYEAGLVDPDTAWADGESAVYRIDVELADADAAQGGTAAHEFVFEARNSSRRPLPHSATNPAGRECPRARRGLPLLTMNSLLLHHELAAERTRPAAERPAAADRPAAAERPAHAALARAGFAAVLASLGVAAAGVAGAAAAGVAPHVELSDSMRPLLRAGDVVWLDRIAASDAQLGDVVAFDDPERDAVVLHRVERIRARGSRSLAFTTRGDANNASESWSIAADGRIGRYVGFRVPHAGRAVLALQGRPLAAIAALSGLTLGGLTLRRIWSR